MLDFGKWIYSLPFGGRVGDGGFKHQTPNNKQQTNSLIN
jgi:hypothetical protein